MGVPGKVCCLVNSDVVAITYMGLLLFGPTAFWAYCFLDPLRSCSVR